MNAKTQFIATTGAKENDTFYSFICYFHQFCLESILLSKHKQAHGHVTTDHVVCLLRACHNNTSSNKTSNHVQWTNLDSDVRQKSS